MKKENLLLSRIWILGFEIIFFTLSAFSTEDKPIAVTSATSPISISNAWIRLGVNPIAGNVEHFYAQESDLLRSDNESSHTASRGSSLVLYARHPLQSTETISLPVRYASQVIHHSSGTILNIRSTSPSRVSLEREYWINKTESVLYATTTIANCSDTPIDLYPTETIYCDASINSNQLPNMLSYFYSPCSTPSSTTKSYEIISSATDDRQFGIVPDSHIFTARYKAKTCEAKLTNDRGWIAFHNLLNQSVIRGGTACVVEYRISEGEIEKVTDNVMIYVNGVKSLDPAQPGEYALDPFMRSSYVLGHVRILPGQTFQYHTTWSLVSCSGPIVDVSQGIAYHKHLETFVAPKVGMFISIANMGIPQEGKLAFLFYDKNGNMRKLQNIEGEWVPQMLVMNLYSKTRPSEVSPFWPTYLGHQILIFSVDDLRDSSDTYEKLIADQVDSIRLVLVDRRDRNVILRELDRVYAPFPIWDKPIE